MSNYEKHSFNDIRLPFIVHIFNNSAEFGSNWHENIEILFFKSGNGTVHINEKDYNVSGGDIIIINQNRIHCIIPDGNLSFCCIIIDRTFCLSNYFDTNSIVFDELIKDTELFDVLEDIIKAYKSKEKNEYFIQHIRAQVLRALVLLCQKYSSKEQAPSKDSHLLSCIKQAIGYIHSESSNDISLEHLSNKIGLSKYYFEKKFKSITGYTPINYLNMIRCDKANFLLMSTSKSIGTISAECGFTDQSYFTKVFKKNIGLLPTQIKRNS